VIELKVKVGPVVPDVWKGHDECYTPQNLNLHYTGLRTL